MKLSHFGLGYALRLRAKLSGDQKRLIGWRSRTGEVSMRTPRDFDARMHSSSNFV